MNKRRLVELCDVIVPMRDKPKVFVSEENGVPWCRIEDIEGKFLNNSISQKYVSKECIVQMNLKVFPVGTVLCAVTGASIGTYAITTRELITNQTFAGLVCKENLLYNEFLYYYIKMHTGTFVNNSVGCAQAYITRETLENFPIPDLEYDEQVQLVKVLKYLDDKININNKINVELEAMAKTIYDYWFLQFDFPDENGKPYKSSGGKMIWNEELKREIPEGWSIDSIVDLCEIVDCLHSKKPEYKYEREDCYLLSLENLSKEGYIDISKKYYISVSDYGEWTKKITVLENDFVVTNAGRAGDIGRISKGIKCAIGRNMTAIRPVSISPYYLRQFFKSNYVIEQIMNNLDCGSFFKSFNVKSIRKLKVIVPNESVMNDFLLRIESLILKIDAINEENRELTSLRDFLLPLLMNGQIGFKEC